MAIIPLRDVVIIEIDKTDETPSGIQLLDSHKDPAGTDTGTIKHINVVWDSMSRDYTVYSNLKPGQKVLFARKHGIAVKGHKKLVCVRYENLLAVIED